MLEGIYAFIGRETDICPVGRKDMKVHLMKIINNKSIYHLMVASVALILFVSMIITTT